MSVTLGLGNFLVIKMRLPNRDKAVVRRPKVLDYLLSTNHPQGRTRLCSVRSSAFRAHAGGLWHPPWQSTRPTMKSSRPRNRGSECVILSKIAWKHPMEDGPRIRAVWFVETGNDTPRFVTAYPLEQEKPLCFGNMKALF